MADVVVLGGGFGGLAAAHTLRQRLDASDTVTLVDRNDAFYMGFAKLWDLAGLRPLAEGTRSLRRLEATGVRFLQADIRRIDPAARTVDTSHGRLEADALVVALGAIAAPAHAQALAHDGAFDLYDGRQVPAMRAALAALRSGRVVVAIVGGPHKCPPAPFEAALIVDQVLRRHGTRDDVEVVMATPKPITLPVAGPDASKYVADHLAEYGIDLRAEHAVASIDGAAKRVAFANGVELDYDLLLGVPANVAPPIVTDSPLAGPSGRIEPDRHTLRTAFERVYAVGDCTMIPTANGELPMAGVFAAAGGEVAAANIAADLGYGEGARYDGHGYCFLELPDERVAFVEGDFYGDPPQVALTEADHAQFLRKQAYERERLDLWLP